MSEMIPAPTVEKEEATALLWSSSELRFLVLRWSETGLEWCGSETEGAGAHRVPRDAEALARTGWRRRAQTSSPCRLRSPRPVPAAAAAFAVNVSSSPRTSGRGLSTRSTRAGSRSRSSSSRSYASSPPAKMASAAADVVVVFDFDQTIIEWDSDDWIITKLGAADAFERLRPTMRWIPLMDRMMGELHAQGKTAEDIRDCLRSAPLDAHVVSAITTASALGCDLRVVSDANTFFIDTVLEHHGVLGYFSEINTNPARVDADGRLRISPFHDSATAPHGCSLCPENMCKGKIIERIQAAAGAKKQHFIYIGDGKGDYCPSFKLREGDYVMPKENFPLWNLICGNKQLLRAEVHPWNNGKELENTLLKLVNKLISPPAMVSQLEYKCEMSNPVSSTEVGCNQALPVPH